MNITHKSKFKRYIVPFSAFIYFIFLCLNATAIKEELKNTLYLCLTSIIPSLYPFCVICAFFTSLGLPDFIKKAIAVLIKPLSLPKEAAEVVLFGWLGGFPVSTKSAVQKVNNGTLSLPQAQTAAMTGFSPGIAFSVYTVGAGFFQNSRLGALMLCCIITSDLMITLLFRKRPTSFIPALQNARDNPYSDYLLQGVDSANHTALQLTGSMMLFSSFTALLHQLISDSLLKGVLLSFCEVTAANLYAGNLSDIYLCEFCLGFGGFCIFLQLSHEFKTLKLSLLRVFIIRLLTGLCSSLLLRLVFLFLPSDTVFCFAEQPKIVLYQTNLFQSISLAFFILLFMASSINRTKLPSFIPQKGRKELKRKNSCKAK